MNEKEIGQLFKEKLSEFQYIPSKAVWMKIEKDQSIRKFNRKHLLKKALYYASAVVIVAVVTSAILLYKNEERTIVNTPISFVNNEIPVVTEGTSGKQALEKIDETIPQIIVPKIEKANGFNKQALVDELLVISQENRSQELENFSPISLLSQSSDKYNPADNQSPTPFKSVASGQKDNSGSDAHNSSVASTTETIVYSRDTVVCRNSKLVLFVRNALSVSWHAGYNSNTLEVYPSEPGIYYVDVVDQQENRFTLAIHVDIIDCGFYIPKAFTPNGDGLNDEFIVYSPIEMNDFELSIFDISSGKLVFKTQDMMHGWDGTEGGKELPQGAYVYMITYKDKLNFSRVEKGQVILIR